MSTSYTPPSPEEAVRGVELPAGEIAAIETLIKIMARLRAPDGCPWDRVQTHRSLLPNLLEEAYEYVDTVQSGDSAKIREELGDLLLQVVFHGQVAQEAGMFTLGDAAQELSEKLVRRHPHVFGADRAADQTEALASWHSAKHKEGAHTLALDQVPRAMPALLRARKVQEKAAKIGFQWPDVMGALMKVDEELAELRVELERENGRKGEIENAVQSNIEEELGDLLFAIVNVARYLHACPEVALTETIEKFIRRFNYIESKLSEAGLALGEASLEKMDGYWEEAKRKEQDL